MITFGEVGMRDTTDKWLASETRSLPPQPQSPGNRVARWFVPHGAASTLVRSSREVGKKRTRRARPGLWETSKHCVVPLQAKPQESRSPWHRVRPARIAPRSRTHPTETPPSRESEAKIG